MDIQNRVKAEKEAIEDIRQRVMRDEEIVSVVLLDLRILISFQVNAPEEINRFVAAVGVRWEQSTSRQKYAKNKHYFNYRNAIWV
jgi:hypothetical protein